MYYVLYINMGPAELDDRELGYIDLLCSALFFLLDSCFLLFLSSFFLLLPSWLHLGSSWLHLGPSWLHLGSILAPQACGFLALFHFLALLRNRIFESICDRGAKTCKFEPPRPADFYQHFAF